MLLGTFGEQKVTLFAILSIYLVTLMPTQRMFEITLDVTLTRVKLNSGKGWPSNFLLELGLSDRFQQFVLEPEQKQRITGTNDCFQTGLLCNRISKLTRVNWGQDRYHKESV